MICKFLLNNQVFRDTLGNKIVFHCVNTSIVVPGGATVVTNSSTDKYFGVGSHGQLFDDGNFHIHAKSGNVWINSLDSGDINLGLQYNSGSGSTVKVGGNLVSKTA